MAQDESEDIEIQEPPLKELTRARRYRRRRWSLGCSPGCLTLLILFFGILAIIFFITTGPKKVKEVPADFPSAIPIYKPKSIEQYVYLSSKRKNRGLEFAAFIPKLVLYPLSRGLDYQSRKKINELAPHIPVESQIIDTKHFLEFMKTPVGPQTNTVALVWKQLTAEPSFLVDFYRGELERAGYALDSTRAAPEVSYFSFRGTGVQGWVSVKPARVEEYGTEEMVLIVEYEN